MFCWNCGTDVDQAYERCSNCGEAPRAGDRRPPDQPQSADAQVTITLGGYGSRLSAGKLIFYFLLAGLAFSLLARGCGLR